MKKIIVLLIVACILCVSVSFAQSQDDIETIDESQRQLRSMPDHVMPGELYVSYSIDKLYHQNIETIRLLAEIKDLLGEQLEQLKENTELLRQQLETLEKSE